MNAKTHTFTVYGHMIRTRTPRRYIVVAVRPHDVIDGDDRYVAFAEVLKRTDNHATAVREMRRFGWRAHGAFAVLHDTQQESDDAIIRDVGSRVARTFL